jgi:hypothetical protein
MLDDIDKDGKQIWSQLIEIRHAIQTLQVKSDQVIPQQIVLMSDLNDSLIERINVSCNQSCQETTKDHQKEAISDHSINSSRKMFFIIGILLAFGNLALFILKRSNESEGCQCSSSLVKRKMEVLQLRNYLSIEVAVDESETSRSYALSINLVDVATEEFGLGVDLNESKAFVWYSLLDSEGNVMIELTIGVSYDNGIRWDANIHVPKKKILLDPPSTSQGKLLNQFRLWLCDIAKAFGW